MTLFNYKNTIAAKLITAVIVCQFFLADAALALAPAPINNPVSESTEKSEEILLSSQEAVLSTSFSILIGQFLAEMEKLHTSGMTERGLSAKFQEFKTERIPQYKEAVLKKIPLKANVFRRFLIDDIYMENGTVCVPYVLDNGARPRILRYSLPGDQNTSSAVQGVSFGGGVRLVVEDPRIQDITGSYTARKDLLPEKRFLPQAKPFRVLHLKGKTFESLFALYGDQRNPKLVIGEGPVEYYTSATDAEFNDHLKKYMPFTLIQAEEQDKTHAEVSYLDGAYTTIIARPGVSKAAVIKEWTEIMIDAGVLGRDYIAATGPGMYAVDMDLITETAREYRSNLALPPTVDLSKKNGGLPLDELNVQGKGPAAALVALKDHPYIKRVHFNGRSPEKIRTAIFGYGYVGSVFARAFFHDYAADTGIEIFAISSSDNLIYSSQAGLPRQLFREVNKRIRKWVTHPLRNIPHYDGVEQAAATDSESVYNAADCVVLASTAHTFGLDEARKVRGKIVMEINPNVATPEARVFMNNPANGITFLSFPAANIGKAYADREWLYNRLIGRPKYNTKAHISGGIEAMTMANIWQVLSLLDEKNTASYRMSYVNFEEASDVFSREFAETTHWYASAVFKDLEDVAAAGMEHIKEKFEFAKKMGIPTKFAAKIAIFNQVYSDAISVQGVDSLEQDLNSEYWQQRRVAAYLLGRKDYTDDEAAKATEMLQKRLRTDDSYLVQAECMKALGRIGPSDTVSFIVDVLAEQGSKQKTLELWEGGWWSIERLRFRYGSERIDGILSADLQNTDLKIDQAKKGVEKSKNQSTYKVLADALYRSALMLHFMGRAHDAIIRYREAADIFVNAQMEGGILPFAIESNIADVYYKMGELKKAREALLKMVALPEVQKLILGNIRGQRMGIEDLSAYSMIYSTYRLNALTRLCAIDGAPEDIAKSLAIAISEYYRERMLDIAVAPAAGSDAQLKEAEDEFSKEYDQKVRGAVDTYVENNRYAAYLKKVVLAGTEIYYNNPEKEKRLLEDLSNGGIFEEVATERADPSAQIPGIPDGAARQASTVRIVEAAFERNMKKLYAAAEAGQENPDTYLKEIDAAVFASLLAIYHDPFRDHKTAGAKERVGGILALANTFRAALCKKLGVPEIKEQHYLAQAGIKDARVLSEVARVKPLFDLVDREQQKKEAQEAVVRRTSEAKEISGPVNTQEALHDARERFLLEVKSLSDSPGLFDKWQYEQLKEGIVKRYFDVYREELLQGDSPAIVDLNRKIAALDTHAAETIERNKAHQARLDHVSAERLPHLIPVPYLTAGSAVAYDAMVFSIHRTNVDGAYAPDTWQNEYRIEVRESGVFKAELFVAIKKAQDGAPVLELHTTTGFVHSPSAPYMYEYAAIQWLWSQAYQSGGSLMMYLENEEDVDAITVLLTDPRILTSAEPDAKQVNKNYKEMKSALSGHENGLFYVVTGKPKSEKLPLRTEDEKISGGRADTSAVRVAQETGLAIDPESEENIKTDLRDYIIDIALHTTSATAASSYAIRDGRKNVILFGTGCIPGYDTQENAQYKWINALIIAIRKFCESRGILFIDGAESELVSKFEEKLKHMTDEERKEYENAHVIGLADFGKIKSQTGISELISLLSRKGNYLFGVNNTSLKPGDFVPVAELIKNALWMADHPDKEIRNSAHMNCEKIGQYWVFSPHTAPVDTTVQPLVYSVKAFA